MKIRNLKLSVFLVAALAQAAHADIDKAGTTAANFLTYGPNAAVLGHGGAGLALSGDLGLLSWNAASLGWLHETEIEFSHANLAASTAQEYLSAGGKLGATPARWSLSGLYQSEGSFEGRDAFNNSTGSFSVSSFAAGGHVAVPIGGVASIGAGLKWVDESLGPTNGGGVTFDAGLQAHAGIFGFGLAAQNAFGKMRFNGTPYEFPTNYGVGISVNHAESGLKLALDANFPTAYYNDVRAGVEWLWRDMMAIRTGYRAELNAPSNEQLSGPTFGVGAGVYGMWIDYGYVVAGNNESEQRISLSLRPGRLNLGHRAMSDDTPESNTHATEPRAQAHASPAPASTTQPAGTPAPQTASTPAGATSSKPAASATTSGAAAQGTTATPGVAATTATKTATPNTSKTTTKKKKTTAKSTKPKSDDPFDKAIEHAAQMKPANAGK